MNDMSGFSRQPDAHAVNSAPCPDIFHPADNKRTSEDRVKLSIAATIKQPGANSFDTLLRDLSPSGFQIECDYLLMLTKPLMIKIPGLQLLTADIRWEKMPAYGCQFRSPLYSAVFENILRQAQTN